MSIFQLHVNGWVHTVDIDGNMPLLWALRDILGLHGTKFGCGVAQCGACSVHINGEVRRSCSIRLGDVKFYFWPDVLPKIEPPRGSGRTAPTRRDELVFSAKVVTPRGHQLDPDEIVERNPRVKDLVHERVDVGETLGGGKLGKHGIAEHQRAGAHPELTEEIPAGHSVDTAAHDLLPAALWMAARMRG